MNIRILRHLLLCGCLVWLAAACTPSEVTVPRGSDCETNADCEDGLCEDGECVPDERWDLFGTCDEDTDCLSEICVDTDRGGICSDSCSSDEDCSDEEGWTCQSSPDYGTEICLPAPTLPPTDGSTICGAGGVSQGGGIRLEHCLAPYDMPSSSLEGDGVRLESGGFQIITE